MYKIMAIMTVALILSVVITARAEKHNGRMEMCEEVGMHYLKTGECINEVEFRSEYNGTGVDIVIDPSIMEGVLQ